MPRLKKFILQLYLSLNIAFRIGYCREGLKYGKRIGDFRAYAHGVRGTVYAVDESTFYVHKFYYDGTGPAAYFWVGNTLRPSPEGIIVPYPDDNKGREPAVLKAHEGSAIILKLPDGRKIKEFKWLSVWCRRFTVNFGEVFIPKDLDPPRPRVLPEFKRFAHGVRSGNVTILDAKTFYIPNLHYDGKGPDTYFLVGNGSEPSSQGIKVPNELGSLEPLKRPYQGEDIELQLPNDLTVYDIDWLAIYCIKYTHNFGHVMVPKDLEVPPSLGQTKISPPWWYNPTSSTTTNPDKRKEMSNCREMLSERLQVQWQVREDRLQVRLSSAIRIDQYIAFGISGDPNKSSMIGSDVVVAFYDENSGKFHAEDYYISASSPCDGKSGVCPDEVINGRNDVKLIYGERRHGITTVIYERILHTNEALTDKPILMGVKTNVIAAIGPLNARSEPNAHALADKTIENTFLDFGSIGDFACSPIESDDDTPRKPWPRSVIRNANVFSVIIGPSGGRKGFSAMTKKPSLGIAWYINGKLMPELHVERGKTYTFIVEGGNIPGNDLQYHPFYITDNAEGAFGQKSEEEQKDQRIFGGISYDSEGNPLPNTAGRYCEWAYKTTDQTTLYDTFEQFFKTLELRCDPGEPAYLNWTVDYETPNLLYYQCYVHGYMGWKIYVEDPTVPTVKKNKNHANVISNEWTINITLILYFFSYKFINFLL
ncbi:protein Skeletor, isoforms B/C [Planococcus citri]|uniref:protein Skeletor, isoforms B/C n=1 Tax=Planococcus citri TaxID=170843 RepID=UPI0031F8025E